jgi:hypothetical protein
MVSPGSLVVTGIDGSVERSGTLTVPNVDVRAVTDGTQKHGNLNRGRCYDHNFLRFLPIFGENIGVFLKNQCYDQLFSKFGFLLRQNRQFFR